MRTLEQYAYALGHNSYQSLYSLFMVLYLNNIIKLPINETSTIFMVCQLTMAFCSFPVGYVSDHFKLYTSKRKSWHLFGSISQTIAIYLHFRRPVVTVWSNFYYYLATGILISLSHQFVVINHFAVIQNLKNCFDDNKTKEKLSSFRWAYLIFIDLLTVGVQIPIRYFIGEVLTISVFENLVIFFVGWNLVTHSQLNQNIYSSY